RRPGQFSGQGRPRQTLSKRSELLGYLILGFGILAAVSVLIMALSGVNKDENLPDPVIAEQLQNDLSQNKAQVAVTTSEEQDLVLKRQKKININDLAGGWQARVGDYTGVMQMNKGLFQIILAHD